MNSLEKFLEKYKLTENQFYGIDKIEGYLDLCSVKKLPDGFNPTIEGSLDLQSVKKLPKNFNPRVGGSLYLSSANSLPKNFSPNVGGSLFLGSVTSLPKNFSPSVGGSIDLRSVISLPKNFSPSVGGSLFLRSVMELPEGFNPKIGGSIDLSSVTSLPEGFNPTVGGSFWLNSVTSLPKNFNPTIGGCLNLISVTELPDGFNPVIGGCLYLKSVTSFPEGFDKSNFENKNLSIIEWSNGFIMCDDKFSQIISKKKNIWKLKDVNTSKEYYLVTDGNGRYAHGKTIKEAKIDLIYKVSLRDKTLYEDIDKEKKMSFVECIVMYRVITGACSNGVRNFIESKGLEQKSFTVKEIISLTKGSYGNESFSQFFNKTL